MRSRQALRTRSLILVGVALGWLLAAFAASPATSGYATVTGGLVAWEWARVASPGQVQVTDIAVRDDGWMLVATGGGVDGFVHLLPPWGGELTTATRLGPRAFGFRQVELRRGRLFGLRLEPQQRGEDTHNSGELWELDASTGAVVADHGTWWYQDLALDPVSQDLVLQTSGDGREPYRHDLVRYDPDSRSQKVLVRDDDPRADRALEVAFSADGRLLFTANVTELPPTIDVRDRDGSVLHSLRSGQIDTLTSGRPGSCFEGLLLVTRSDGSVWGTRTESGAAPTLLAAGGRPGVVSYSGLDRDGNLATARYGDVTLLACPGFVPPRPPQVAPPSTTVSVPVGAAAVAAPPPARRDDLAAPPAPSTPPAPPPGAAAPPAPPAPPAPAPVAPPSALGAAAQTAAAPAAGVADSPDEEHITSVAASSPQTFALSFGAVVVMAMVSYVFVAAPGDALRTQRVRGPR